MRIKWKPLSIIWKALIIYVVVQGILTGSGYRSGTVELRFFISFPNVVCIAALLYYVAAFAWLIWYAWVPERVTFFPLLKHLVLISSIGSFMLIHYLLEDINRVRVSFGDYAFFLYYVLPLMMLLDWFLFDEKGIWEPWEPYVWLVAPFGYLASVLVSVEVFHSTLYAMPGEDPYPYVFIEPEIVGIGGLVIVASIIIMLYLVAGFIGYGLDQMLRGRNTKKAAAKRGKLGKK